jgi:hypothetical protein
MVMGSLTQVFTDSERPPLLRKGMIPAMRFRICTESLSELRLLLVLANEFVTR